MAAMTNVAMERKNDVAMKRSRSVRACWRLFLAEAALLGWQENDCGRWDYSVDRIGKAVFGVAAGAAHCVSYSRALTIIVAILSAYRCGGWPASAGSFQGEA